MGEIYRGHQLRGKALLPGGKNLAVGAGLVIPSLLNSGATIIAANAIR